MLKSKRGNTTLRPHPDAPINSVVAAGSTYFRNAGRKIVVSGRHLAAAHFPVFPATDGEFQASKLMTEAAKLYGEALVAIKLRELQTLAEIAREKNLIIVTPSGDVEHRQSVIG